MPAVAEPLLVADVGGTHVRFALCDATAAMPYDVAVRLAADYPRFELALDDFLDGIGRPRLAGAALAIAATPAGDADRVALTNSPWIIDRRALASRLGLAEVMLLNDFEALALAVPTLSPSQRHELRSGAGQPGAVRAVLGPGTGLGVAGLVPPAPGSGCAYWRALPGEGGHVGFAPADELEIALLRALAVRYGRVSAERVLSGDGLVALHAFLAGREGHPSQERTAADISARALADPESLAARSVARFCAMLGRFTGDVTLTLGAWDGVYLGGGIVPRILPLLARSDFLAHFLDKGRMARCLEPVPVYVITDTLAALQGAAQALRQGAGVS